MRRRFRPVNHSRERRLRVLRRALDRARLIGYHGVRVLFCLMVLIVLASWVKSCYGVFIE